jgi:acetolactate synthase-1/2/3 large subunit
MAEIYGGHLAARYLKEVEGVSTVFSLSGGHIDMIYDGFIEYGVDLIDVRHEQAAVMMGPCMVPVHRQAGRVPCHGRPGFLQHFTRDCKCQA